VSRRNFDGLKPPNPSSFGVRGGLGRKAEVQNPNRVSAKCAIGGPAKAASATSGSGLHTSHSDSERATHEQQASGRRSITSEIEHKPEGLATAAAIFFYIASAGLASIHCGACINY
jgi:hypothetical protein